MTARLLRRAGVCLVLATLAAGAGAAEKKVLGTFGDWDAFETKRGKAKVCYTASLPTKSVGKYDNRGETSVIVSHWPSQEALNVVNVVAGYAYKPDGKVKIIIGKQSFTLFTDGGRAWAEESKTDRALVRAMRKGASMTVKGTSSRGTATTDTYSLKGFTTATIAIGKSGGVNGP